MWHPHRHRWLAALLCMAALCGTSAGLGETDHGAWRSAGAGASTAGASAVGGLRRLGETARRGLGEMRRLWPKRGTPQLNVTGTFRGEWSQLAWPQQLALGGSPLAQGAGVTVLKLRHVGGSQVIDPCSWLHHAAFPCAQWRLCMCRALSAWVAVVPQGRCCLPCATPAQFVRPKHCTASMQGGVFGVDGEMVLRDGQYVSTGDLLLSLTVGSVCLGWLGRHVGVVCSFGFRVRRKPS